MTVTMTKNEPKSVLEPKAALSADLVQVSSKKASTPVFYDLILSHEILEYSITLFPQVGTLFISPIVYIM